MTPDISLADAASLLSQVERMTVLTPKQREIQDDPARFKIIVCGRGSGKTVVAGKDLLDGARKVRGSNNGYATGTRRMAKNIMWPVLLAMNEKNRLGFEVNHSDLTMKHPASGGRIQLMGANNVVEINKARGQDWHKFKVDEGQILGKTLKALIDDCVVPRLIGDLWLLGTPSTVPAGPFWDAWEQAQRGKGWSPHHFTMAENPYQLRGRTFETIIAEECERRGVTPDDPTIQREFFGVFVRDLDAMVVRLSERNYFDEVPDDLDEYVVGIDVGYNDADAISVLGWKWVSEKPQLYLVEEIVNRNEKNSDLGDRVKDVIARYHPMAVSMDMGGLALKTSKDFEEFWDVPIEPFNKTSKTGRAMLLRRAIDRGELMVRKGGPFDEDCKLLQWEHDSFGNRHISDKSPEDKSFHSDIFDSVLGGYLCSMAHRSTKPAAKVDEVQAMKEERKFKRAKAEAGVHDDLFGGETAPDGLFGDNAGGGDLWAK